MFYDDFQKEQTDRELGVLTLKTVETPVDQAILLHFSEHGFQVYFVGEGKGEFLKSFGVDKLRAVEFIRDYSAQFGATIFHYKHTWNGKTIREYRKKLK